MEILCREYQNKVYDKYHKTVYRKCFNFTKNSCLSEELTQDVFIKFFKKYEREIQKLDTLNRIKPYLLTIAHHECVNYYRRKTKLQTRSIERATRSQILKFSKEEEISEIEDVRRSNADYIYENLGKYIPNNQDRFVFEKKHLENMPYKEIQEKLFEMGIIETIDNLKKKKSRTLKKLKELIKEKHPNYLTRKIRKK